jgi:hypothetical protein
MVVWVPVVSIITWCPGWDEPVTSQAHNERRAASPVQLPADPGHR